MLIPIKAIINEQITAMYSFQTEIKAEVKRQDDRCHEYGRMFDMLDDKFKRIDRKVISDDNIMKQGRHSRSPTRPITPPSRNLSPIEELHARREEILRKRSPSHEKKSSKNLTNLNTGRSGKRQKSVSPDKDFNSDFKTQVDVSMQSGELLVDLMKLQNILNFEVQKML